MDRAEEQGAQDQHVKRALQHVDRFVFLFLHKHSSGKSTRVSVYFGRMSREDGSSPPRRKQVLQEVNEEIGEIEIEAHRQPDRRFPSVFASADAKDVKEEIRGEDDHP